MAGGHRGRGCAGRIVHRRLYEREVAVPGGPADLCRILKHPGRGRPALWADFRCVHVFLRNRVITVAGGDHRSSGDGEEEDLNELRASSYEPRVSKIEVRS